jgi:hypothetical protein
MKSQKNNKLFISQYETSNIPTGYDLYLFENLDEIPNHSLEQIFISDLLDGYVDRDIYSILNTVISKLKHNGILHIQSLDLEQFCVYMNHRIIGIERKSILYNNRINIQSLSSLCDILIKNSNITILSRKYVNGFEYYIEAKIIHEK